ncbi:MAG: polyphosphate kinase 2 [Flavobacteriaceae bacterium]|jgi:polyphosphate kinase|nr:polyphosphate kinase 2 [Flavobacteriaceae bacterium]
MLTIDNFKSLENGDITKKQFLKLIKSTSSSAKLEKILYDLEYEDQLYKLQSELVNFQEWVTKNKKRVCVIFEGRDAAGKGGAIRRMTEHLNPRARRVVALSKPTEIEQGQWYFRRYIKEMPNPGELVFFDRSWYNRAVVEPVMGFCDKAQYNKFMIQVPEFEHMLYEDGIILIKFWFSVTKDEQLRRFESRLESPLKKWKFSPVDEEGQNKWDDYTHYKDQMFTHTHTTFSPWIIIKTNNKKEARLESLRHVLSRFDYDGKGSSGVTLLPDPNIVQRYHRTSKKRDKNEG